MVYLLGMEVIRDSGSAAPEVPGFDVGRLLGRGSTAAVWLVTERSTGREFALKCFDAGGDATDDTGGIRARDAEEALRREVRILSALEHDHLLRAHAVLRVRRPWSGLESGDGLGLVLDYAPGGSVAELVAGRGLLGAGETVTVLTPIAQALEYLHSQGFTHGDVSPGNVLFTAHGKPLLADVGVARMVADVGSSSVAGTEGFSDPAPVDAVRAGLQPERDVYSLAALGWYCLTGQPPGPDARRPPLPLLVPGVPAALAAALEAGLDEDRRQRPSAAELATAVYRSAAAEPVDLSVTAHPTVVPHLLTRRAVPRTARERRAERLRSWFRRWRGRRRGSHAALTAGAARPGAVADAGHPPGGAPLPGTGRAAETSPADMQSRAALPGAHSRPSPAATARHAASGGTARHSAAGSRPDPRSGSVPDRAVDGRYDGGQDDGHDDRYDVDSRRVGAQDGGHDVRHDVRHGGRHGGRRDVGNGTRQDAGNDARRDTSNIGHGSRHGTRQEIRQGVRRGPLAAGRRRGRRKAWAGWAAGVALLAGLGGSWLFGGGSIPELFAVFHPSAATPDVHAAAETAAAETETEASDGSSRTEGAGEPVPDAAAIPAGLRDLLDSDDPGEAVRGLAALRSLAFRSGNLRLLAEVNVPASDAAAADARIAAPLATVGHVLWGFETTLTRVQAAANGGPDRAVVAVTAASSPYQERDAAGAVVAEAPAGEGIRLRLVLASVDGRWRIAQILAGDPASG